MGNFSTDVDLVKYEPMIFRDVNLPGQTSAAGQAGVISGTTLTDSGADFVTAGVSGGTVIHVKDDSGQIDAAYEVVSVDSATSLTISVVRHDSDDPARMPISGTGLTWRIVTYDPQAEEIRFEILGRLGLAPADASSDVIESDVLEPRVLRKASVFGVLGLIYTGATGTGPTSEIYWNKAKRYARLFSRAINAASVVVDLDGDGVGDQKRSLSSVTLRRA